MSVPRRARVQATRFGDEVRQMRLQQGLTIQAAADRAGVAWRTWERVEAGDPMAKLGTMCVIGQSIGLDLVINAYVGRLPSLRDTGQLELAARVMGEASVLLKPTIELAVGTHGQSIDLVCFGPHEILAIEIERFADYQAQYRRADQKRSLLADMHQRPVRLVIAVEDVRRNRTALEPHAGIIATALPAGTREILRAIRTGEPLGRDGLLWIRRPPRRS